MTDDQQVITVNTIVVGTLLAQLDTREEGKHSPTQHPTNTSLHQQSYKGKKLIEKGCSRRRLNDR